MHGMLVLALLAVVQSLIKNKILLHPLHNYYYNAHVLITFLMTLCDLILNVITMCSCMPHGIPAM